MVIVGAGIKHVLNRCTFNILLRWIPLKIVWYLIVFGLMDRARHYGRGPTVQTRKKSMVIIVVWKFIEDDTTDA